MARTVSETVNVGPPEPRWHELQIKQAWFWQFLHQHLPIQNQQSNGETLWEVENKVKYKGDAQYPTEKKRVSWMTVVTANTKKQTGELLWTGRTEKLNLRNE